MLCLRHASGTALLCLEYRHQVHFWCVGDPVARKEPIEKGPTPHPAPLDAPWCWPNSRLSVRMTQFTRRWKGRSGSTDTRPIANRWLAFPIRDGDACVFPFTLALVSRGYQSYASDPMTLIPGLEYRSITRSFAWRPRTFHHSKYLASVRLSRPRRNVKAFASETWLTRSTTW